MTARWSTLGSSVAMRTRSREHKDRCQRCTRYAERAGTHDRRRLCRVFLRDSSRSTCMASHRFRLRGRCRLQQRFRFPWAISGTRWRQRRSFRALSRCCRWRGRDLRKVETQFSIPFPFSSQKLREPVTTAKCSWRVSAWTAACVG